MRYHKKFQHFKPKTLTITRTLLRDWGRSSNDLQWLKMNAWLTQGAEIYGIPRPNLIQDSRAGYGCYQLATNNICMSKPSVITLLHEFRHALQNHQRATGFNNDPRQVEPDARAWSLSLYYRVAPRSFRRLVAQGSIFFVSTNDLTRG